MSKSPYSTAMLSLVQCIEQHPILWDKNNMFYKNIKRTDKAWCTVAGKLKMNRERCRLKWSRLRNSFLRMVTPDGKINLKRIRFNKTLYENMIFLLPVIKQKNSEDDNKENVNKENVNEENVNEENVNKENELKKIPKLIKEQIQKNQMVIANTQGIAEQFYEPILYNNFGDIQVFSHWPSTLCTPILQLKWITPLEVFVTNSSSMQQNNVDGKFFPYGIKGLQELLILDKTELNTETDIQEENSYFR